VPGILEPPTSLAWGLHSCRSCISRHFALHAFTLDALWSASFSSYSLVLHVSSSCSIRAFCCSLHHGIIIKSLPCCLTCMLSHENCSLRSPSCPLLDMYYRLFVLCRFLLEYWSSRVGNKTCSRYSSGVHLKIDGKNWWHIKFSGSSMIETCFCHSSFFWLISKFLVWTMISELVLLFVGFWKEHP